jgi:CHAT domain-containing protein/tetratricopeptide (TPR) repeat protein
VAASAEHALTIATGEPKAARAEAREILTSRDRPSARDSIIAYRALGLAARTLMDFEESLDCFATAIELAQRAGVEDEAARTKVSRAAAFALSGQPDDALVDIDAALRILTGHEYTEALNQKAAILCVMGRFDEALAEMNRTIRVFHQLGNTVWEARARANRSYVHMMTGAVDAGEREARAAQALYQSLGHETGVAYMAHHLAVLAGLRGDIPTALDRFGQVEKSYRKLGIPGEQGADAQVSILLSAHLARDALRVAAVALDELAHNDNTSAVPELLLAAARAEVMLDDHARARAAAEEASANFTKRGLHAWAANADLLVVSARFAMGERSAELQAMAEATAQSLAHWAWPAASLDAQLLAGRIALSRGQRVQALQLLSVAAAHHRGRALASRVSGWHARALIEVIEGRPRSAQRALTAGLTLVEDFREALGATEMRVGAAGHARDLAKLGMELAFAQGRAAEIFSWSERYRAAALLQRPSRPPKDRQLAKTLTRLRAVSGRLEQTAVEGPVAAQLRRQQRDLEDQVRRLSYLARGRSPGSHRRPSASALRPYLRRSAWVQLVINDDELHAVIVKSGTARHSRLALLSQIRKELAAVRFDLGHLARRPKSASAATMRANLEHGLDHLDELIFGPVRSLLQVERLVVSPPGELMALPWNLLRSGRGRLVSVVPSAALWLRAAAQPPPKGTRSVLAAGPGLRHATQEVTAIAGLLGAPTTLMGANATASAVARALEGAALAHLACHGNFRADNPSFSSLQFADGPLYVYDLERLRRPPQVMVLSACESGRAAASAGDELRGLIAALLSLGTRAVIASVVPVHDEASHGFMIAMHRRLAAGASPAGALAETQEAFRQDQGAAGIAVAGAFLCFGAGWPVIESP